MFGQLTVTGLHILQGLGLFAGRLRNEDRLKTRGFERGHRRLAIAPGHSVIGNHRTPAAELETRALGAEVREQSAPDTNRVGAVSQRYLDRAHGLRSGSQRRDGIHAHPAGLVAQLHLHFRARFTAKDGLAQRGKVTDAVVVGVAIPRAHDGVFLALIVR